MRKMFRQRHKSESSQPPPADGADEVAVNEFFDIGVSCDCNKRYRKTMEDTHRFILGFLGIPGCAFFGVFDGHAGSQTAKYCSDHLHTILATELRKAPREGVTAALARSFNEIDHRLEQEHFGNSGCTAVVAVVCFVSRDDATQIVPAGSAEAVRKIFVANVGDARAVLRSREYKETWRLSYDHRGSDPYEQKRIINAGGILMSNRVNGVLAVTRSLGDLYMKEYVVGDPYTTETQAQAGDILILACDGLWDVCSDSQATEIIENTDDSGLKQSRVLLDHALAAFTTDNMTVMVIKLL